MEKKDIIKDCGRQIFVNLTNEEINEFADELEKVLDKVKTIDKVNTDDVKEDVSVLQQSNAFRKDEVVEFKDKKLLLQNAAEVEDGMYKIPKVL